MTTVDADPPSPRASAMDARRLLFALCAAPAGWIAQLCLDYGLSSYACFPHNAAGRVSPPPGWAFEKPLLLTLNAACLALIAAGFALGWAGWREARGGRGRVGGAERSRILAQCAMLAAAGFGTATVFGSLFVLFTPTCWSFR